jgi:hypothetical protein
MRTYTPSFTAESSTLGGEYVSNKTANQTFEGNSSMAAHTEFASEFFEHALKATTTGHLDPDLQNALTSLKQIVSMRGRQRDAHENCFVHQKPLPKGGIYQMTLPPTDIVLKLLREVQGQLLPLLAYIDLLFA